MIKIRQFYYRCVISGANIYIDLIVYDISEHNPDVSEIMQHTATYSFDGHNWTSELSGHLDFLLLKILKTGHSKTYIFHITQWDYKDQTNM